MKIKLLTVVLFTIFALALSTESAFASNKNNSNKNKSVNHSFVQGNSKSDPDDNGKGPDRSNGGFDKPGYTGGINSDRDGNNGCGNDTDREDDNEGWCGRKPKQEVVCPKPTPKPEPVVVIAPKTPVVASAITVKALPQTGNTENDFGFNFAVVATLIISGFGLLKISKGYEVQA